MLHKPLILICVFTVLFLSSSINRPAFSQALAQLVTEKQPIPKGFKTYSLFLVCNPQWLDPSKNTGLFQLYRQFQSFGRAIGGDQLAVWFWKSNSYEHNDARLAEIVDVERSVRFCKAWKLKPSEGPHLVITSTFPDEAHLFEGLPPDSAVYKLGDMSPSDISALLTRLTDTLIASGTLDKSGTPTPQPKPGTLPAQSGGTAPPSLWIRLLTATQQTINSFGCAWSFKLNAGPVSADLKSCKPST